MRRYCSFVIRILLDDERDCMVAGQVVRVGTQETTYFQNFDEMLEIMRSDLQSSIEGGHTQRSDITPRSEVEGHEHD